MNRDEIRGKAEKASRKRPASSWTIRSSRRRGAPSARPASCASNSARPSGRSV